LGDFFKKIKKEKKIEMKKHAKNKGINNNICNKMSLNLNPIFNAEQRQRRCGHCSLIGHNITRCRRARSDGYNLHLRIVNGMQNNHSNLNEFVRLTLLNMTLHQLKLLMTIVGIFPQCQFIREIERINLVPVGTSLLIHKQDRVVVMLWFYCNQTRPSRPETNLERKINIQTILVNPEIDDSSPFDCPICLETNACSERLVSNCNHAVCHPCMIKYLDHQLTTTNFQIPCCSLCRTKLTSITYTNKDFSFQKYV